MSDPIRVEPFSTRPILIEPLGGGAPEVIAFAASVGPFGPVANVSTTLALTVNGNGSVIVPGVKGDLPVSWTGQITGWYLIGDLAGSVTVDVLVGRPAEGVPFASITGGNGPQMLAVDAAEGDALGWIADLTDGDVIRVTITALTVIRRLTVALFVERN